ncbi:MAG TPA: hypothetical protein VGM56_32395 [Byssovorax sp.]
MTRSFQLGAAVVLGLTLAATPARAQGDMAAAQALYDQATHAMDAGDYATACPKLEEVVRLAPDGVGGRLTLGECYEKAGKLATAWAAYTAAESVAARLNQAARVDKAHKAAEALRRRLATLTIQVPPAVASLEGLAVQRDGVSVGAAAWGTSIPIDAGTHTVTARAKGKLAWHKDVQAAKDGVAVTVVVEALASAPVVVEGGPAPAPAPPVDAAPPPRSRFTPLVIAAFAVGGAGIVTGTVTGILTLSQGSTCKTACSQSDLDGAKTTAWVSDVSFGVGVAGAAVGVLGLVLARPRSSAPSATTIDLGPRSISLRTSF